MEKKLNLHDYYLGVIVATPEYLNNPKKNRYLGDVNFDPFGDMNPFSAVTFGMITLLKKEVKDGKERYVDQYYSRYRNEISYTLHDRNKLGIVLAHVKPFLECYRDLPTWYKEEEFIERCMDTDFYYSHTYYIAVKETGEEAIVILNELPAESVQVDYFRDFLGEKEFSDIVQLYENTCKSDYETTDPLFLSYHNLIQENDLTLSEFIQTEWCRRQLLSSFVSSTEGKSEYTKNKE